MSSSSIAKRKNPPPLVIATRLHLGHASHPPPRSQLYETLSTFARTAAAIGADHALVAVDAEEKLEGYDLVREVSEICKLQELSSSSSSSLAERTSCDDDGGDDDGGGSDSGGKGVVVVRVLPVTPWGKFVPALNAIVMWSARIGARYLLFASAEVQLTRETMDVLMRKLDLETTLVVGTALGGHEYTSPGKEEQEEVEVALTGRTTPWNTCALWNLPKLALTGFLLVSEGLHPDEDGAEGSGGVEEAVAIAALQRILSKDWAQAKLVSIPGTSWEQDFGNDEKRREWHERKMRSKFTRAQRQLDLMGLSGTVKHC